MPNIAEIRRNNARKLLNQSDSVNQFASVIKRSPSQVCALIGPKPRRNIGAFMARHIEKCFGLEDGVLDIHSDSKSPLQEAFDSAPEHTRKAIELMLQV
jgi:plasmid maintenance system antidote protein VapI